MYTHGMISNVKIHQIMKQLTDESRNRNTEIKNQTLLEKSCSVLSSNSQPVWFTSIQPEFLTDMYLIAFLMLIYNEQNT